MSGENPSEWDEKRAESRTIPSDTPLPVPSWERRDEFGVFHALYRTALEIFLARRATFRNMSATGGYEGPLLFLIITCLIGISASLLFGAAYNLRLILQGREGDVAAAVYQFLVRTGPAAVVLPPCIFVNAFVLSAASHAVLRKEHPGLRFEPVFRVVCYSIGTAMLFLLVPVPYLNAMLGCVWFFLACSTGLDEIHQGEWRTVSVCFVWMILFGLGCSCLIGALISLALGEFA